MQTTLLSPTFVRKLSITLLTIKDSHDKNETCKNKRYFTQFEFFPTFQIQSLIAFQVKYSFPNCKLHLHLLIQMKIWYVFVPKDNLYVDQSYNVLNAKMYFGSKGAVNQFTTCCTIVNYKLDFVFLSRFNQRSCSS